MATGQPQQVVVVQQQPVQMQPMGQTNVVQNTGNGETNQTQTVVVVQQQPVTGQSVQDHGNRFPRWPYLLFGIGFGSYHFIYIWFWMILSLWSAAWTGGGHYGTLFFFCGLVPSLIAFIWIINDSTVFCTNPGTGDITKTCCCECVNGYVMTIPMAIAGLLRLILWFAFFGILADALNGAEGDFLIDNVFWIILSIGSIDVGPFILLTLDWWYYYGKRDYNGLFGHKLQPLRCITGESIVIMICSWSFIALFEEYADDAAEYIWPWILHGILSTAILVFAMVLQFSGSIQGPYVGNIISKFVCWGLAIAQAILTLIILGYILSWAFGLGWGWFFSLLMLVYGTYYAGLTVPTIWALFSIQVRDNNNGQNAV